MKVIIYLAASAIGLIMGKKTYDYLSPDHLPLREGSLVVLTHDTKATSSQTNVLFTDDKPEAIISQLAAKGHTEALIIGGTQTLTEFVTAGLVNEIILVVEPVLFGSGLSITRGLEFEYKLSLLELKTLNDHTVKLHYEIKG